MNECLNEWTNKCLNEWMNKWMFEWMNEWMNVLMNEWMNECLNEWMFNAPQRLLGVKQMWYRQAAVMLMIYVLVDNTRLCVFHIKFTTLVLISPLILLQFHLGLVYNFIISANLGIYLWFGIPNHRQDVLKEKKQGHRVIA